MNDPRIARNVAVEMLMDTFETAMDEALEGLGLDFGEMEEEVYDFFQESSDDRDYLEDRFCAIEADNI